jgi:hypothetical protein
VAALLFNVNEFGGIEIEAIKIKNRYSSICAIFCVFAVARRPMDWGQFYKKFRPISIH